MTKAEAGDKNSAFSAVIIGAGAQTSIGFNLPMTAACVRCGMNRFALSEYLRDRECGEPISLALLKALPEELFAFDRMKVLAIAAAKEALAPWLKILSSRQGANYKIPVIISVPPVRPGFHEGEGKRLIQEIIKELPIKPDEPRCGMLDTGHEGGLAALGYAVDLLRNDAIPACLIGGVDCYKDIDTLHWIESLGRLKKADQPHGFLPGEGSGFILVCSKKIATYYQLKGFCEIMQIGRAIEPKPWYLNNPTIGEGLTKALQQVLKLEGSKGYKADVTYSDLNGESWRADEWGYAYLRTAKYHGEPLDIKHPADCWGDVGAASGTLLVGVACDEFSRHRHAKKTALIWSASDTRTWRSACLLHKIQE